MTLSLPPFTRAVTWLVGINTGIFLLRFVLELAPCRRLHLRKVYLALTPAQVVFHGWVWQLVTYSFVHFEFWHWFGNMLGLWMFGSAIESAWGTRRFVELFSIGVIGAAITTVALSMRACAGRSDAPHDRGLRWRIRHSDCVRNFVRGTGNHDDSVPVPDQSEIFCRHSDRGRRWRLP